MGRRTRSYLESKKNHQRYYIRKVSCFRNISGWILGRTRTERVKNYIKIQRDELYKAYRGVYSPDNEKVSWEKHHEGRIMVFWPREQKDEEGKSSLSE